MLTTMIHISKRIITIPLETSSVLERSCKEGRTGNVEGLKDIWHEVVPLAVYCTTVCRKGGFRKTGKTAKIVQCDHWFPHELTSKNEHWNSILMTCHYQPDLSGASDWLR